MTESFSPRGCFCYGRLGDWNLQFNQDDTNASICQRMCLSCGLVLGGQSPHYVDCVVDPFCVFVAPFGSCGAGCGGHSQGTSAQPGYHRRPRHLSCILKFSVSACILHVAGLKCTQIGDTSRCIIGHRKTGKTGGNGGARNVAGAQDTHKQPFNGFAITQQIVNPRNFWTSN